MKSKKLVINTTLALIGAVLGCASSSSEDIESTGSGSAQGPRIAVFNTRAVAMAYARSSRPDCMLARVQEIRATHQKAEENGDESKAQDLAAEAVAIQEKIHGQVFSDAPIPEILQLIKSEMAAIAKAANVDLIVGQVLYESKEVALIDITEHMIAPFEPDAKTRQGIKELLKTQPVPLSELKQGH